MGPTGVLSDSDGPHVGPMNLGIRDTLTLRSTRASMNWVFIVEIIVCYMFGTKLLLEPMLIWCKFIPGNSLPWNLETSLPNDGRLFFRPECVLCSARDNTYNNKFKTMAQRTVAISSKRNLSRRIYIKTVTNTSPQTQNISERAPTETRADFPTNSYAVQRLWDSMNNCTLSNTTIKYQHSTSEGWHLSKGKVSSDS